MDLRHILSEQLEEFEILFRTKIAFYIGSRYGALGHLSRDNFESDEFHKAFLEDFEREKRQQSKSPVVRHHEEKYSGMMPIWAAVEVLSFGTISKLYSNMKPNDRAAIAKEFGVSEVFLRSWLRSFVEVRNICAHYGRLYNKVLRFPPRLFKDVSFSNPRVFSVLYILKRYIDPQNWISQMMKLKRSVLQHQSIELQKIGFPPNWENILSNDL